MLCSSQNPKILNYHLNLILYFQLVEKLSAVAPDGQAKIKILSAIAEEHNVNWDPKSFDKKDPVPPTDLLVDSSIALGHSTYDLIYIIIS